MEQQHPPLPQIPAPACCLNINRLNQLLRKIKKRIFTPFHVTALLTIIRLLGTTWYVFVHQSAPNSSAVKKSVWCPVYLSVGV